MLKVGDPAPAFTVLDHTGKQRTLGEFKGKRVVLWFFPRAETPGCTVEGCAFRDHYAEFRAKDVVVLGVSVDPVEANRKFVENQKFPFALLSDTDRKLSVAYGAAADLKANYANRITVVIGPDGKVEQVVEKVAVATHAKSLLDSLPSK